MSSILSSTFQPFSNRLTSKSSVPSTDIQTYQITLAKNINSVIANTHNYTGLPTDIDVSKSNNLNFIKNTLAAVKQKKKSVVVKPKNTEIDKCCKDLDRLIEIRKLEENKEKTMGEILDDLIRLVDDKVLEEEGIFRISDDSIVTNTMYEKLTSANKADALNELQTTKSAPLLSYLIKKCVCEGLSHVNKTKISHWAIEYSKNKQLPETTELPLLLQKVMSLFSRVLDKSSINKMSENNLANIFSPNINIPSTSDDLSVIVVENLSQIKFLTKLLEDYHKKNSPKGANPESEKSLTSMSSVKPQISS
ncbi:RhoGAP domain-containing protein [Yersinia bercovieri]|uniref:RhoGAP domain-containing protein n=1 Tax=Yersinia bercovieri TaxID=634 RepID=UPI0011AB80C7|nr:RhoGAP domain-containing protein [Yersinia bercovieri]